MSVLRIMLVRTNLETHGTLSSNLYTLHVAVGDNRR